MNVEKQREVLIIDVLNAMRKHWKLMLVFMTVYMLMVVGIAIVLPRKYESTGKLFVRLGRGGVTLDPTATTSETIMIQESRESEINSIIDVLESRRVLESVVAEIGPERILSTKSLFAKLPIPRLSSFIGTSGTDGDDIDYGSLLTTNEAIEKLYDNLAVRTPRKAATISVTVESESPKLSRDIVDVLMSTYLDQHVKARQTNGSYRFFQEQYNAQNEKVQACTQRVADFKNRTGIISIGDSQVALREHQSSIEREIVDAQTRLEAAESRFRRTQELILTLPQNVALETMTGVANQATDLMRDRLYELEIAERNLANRFTDDHPQLIAIRQQLEEARRLMAGEINERTQTKQTLNENVLALQLDGLNAQADVAASQAEVDYLKQQLEGIRDRVQRLNSQAVELAMLERELHESEASQAIYAEKLEEARINQALDNERISNVDIIQPATFQVKYVSPSYLLILIGGIASAFLGAIGIAYFKEIWWGETVRTVVREEPNSLLLQPRPKLSVEESNTLNINSFSTHESLVKR
ncbi:MAG: GumC family protein [Planctomycetales bacterium]|nr:GumC family protein [Planctomycetales bacterium]